MSIARMLGARSIAVVGASRDPRKWGRQVLRNTLDMGCRRSLFAINPSLQEAIDDVAVFPSIAAVADEIDIALIAVPREATIRAVRECVESKVPAVVIPASGFGERSESGDRAEQELRALIDGTDTRIVGPNCFGFYSSVRGVNLTPFPDIPSGRTALLSQSGNVAAQLFIGARDRAFGFSHCIGLGNQLDVSFVDLLDILAADRDTDAVALYIEGLPTGQGGAFRAALRRCVAAGKLVTVLKGGRSKEGAVASLTHTRSLSSDALVWTTALTDDGAICVESVGDLLDVLSLSASTRPFGPRVGLVTDGGGDSILALDHLSGSPLQVRPYTPETSSRLEEVLPLDAPRATGNNPLTLDAAGGLHEDPLLLVRVVERIIGSGEVDTIVVAGLFGTYHDHRDAELRAARELVHLARPASVNLLVQSVLDVDDSTPLQILRDGGVPLFASMVGLVRAVSALTRPDSSEKPCGEGSRSTAQGGGLMLDPTEAAGRLALTGLSVPTQLLAIDEVELRAAVQRVSLPVCLKVSSSEIVHKSEVHGVVTGLDSEERALDAARSLWQRFPDSSLLVMPSFAPGFEVLLGARTDPDFGPVIVIGRGGVWAEVDPDVVVQVGAADLTQFRVALRRLRCWPILDGRRGQPPMDVAALHAVACALLEIAVSAPTVEIDLNPVILYESGYALADIRMIDRASRSHRDTADLPVDQMIAPTEE